MLLIGGQKCLATVDKQQYVQYSVKNTGNERGSSCTLRGRPGESRGFQASSAKSVAQSTKASSGAPEHRRVLG